MALRAITGIHPQEVRDAISELQRKRVTVVAGAAAGTLRTNKMAIAAMRAEDTILSVITIDNAAGNTNAFVDDTAQAGISDIKAEGTLTLSGNPVNDETFVVNGKTYTFKTTPTLMEHVKIVAGDNTAMAVNMARAINAWENRRLTNDWNKPAVVATPSGAVVTVRAVAEGAAGNSITFTESVTNLAISGAGTLTGGSDTGGIFSTTNNTGRTCLVFWYDKQ